jgi:hypothetical protein
MAIANMELVLRSSRNFWNWSLGPATVLLSLERKSKCQSEYASDELKQVALEARDLIRIILI